jgi:hypothetical protein
MDTKAGEAHAKMDNGKGEVILERVKGDDPAHEIVVHNLKYWLAQSNNGFRMWKSKHEAFEGHGRNFSYDGTNGFLITIHFSGQAKAPAADSARRTRPPSPCADFFQTFILSCADCID